VRVLLLRLCRSSSLACLPYFPPLPTRRSSDLRDARAARLGMEAGLQAGERAPAAPLRRELGLDRQLALRDRIAVDEVHDVLRGRSEEHTSELQSHLKLVCRLLLAKKKTSEHDR